MIGDDILQVKDVCKSFGGVLDRTRPLCPYPGFARYTGTGDTNKAENFICAFSTEIRIEPETLNLNKGTFTAFITVPEIYEGKDWKIVDVICEGASAVKVNLSGHGETLIAKFNRQDLKNITPGKAVTFTVTAFVEYNGDRIAFEGSDSVRVISRK